MRCSKFMCFSIWGNVKNITEFTWVHIHIYVCFKNYFKDRNQIFNSVYVNIVEEWISNGSGD